MERKQKLSGIVMENDRIAVSRYIEKEGTALYQGAEAKELERVVAKRKENIRDDIFPEEVQVRDGSLK